MAAVVAKETAHDREGEGRSGPGRRPATHNGGRCRADGRCKTDGPAPSNIAVSRLTAILLRQARWDRWQWQAGWWQDRRGRWQDLAKAWGK